MKPPIASPLDGADPLDASDCPVNPAADAIGVGAPVVTRESIVGAGEAEQLVAAAQRVADGKDAQLDEVRIEVRPDSVVNITLAVPVAKLARLQVYTLPDDCDETDARIATVAMVQKRAVAAVETAVLDLITEALDDLDDYLQSGEMKPTFSSDPKSGAALAWPATATWLDDLHDRPLVPRGAGASVAQAIVRLLEIGASGGFNMGLEIERVLQYAERQAASKAAS